MILGSANLKTFYALPMLPWKPSVISSLLLVLCLALFSCDDNNAPANASKIDNDLIGIWKIDSEATLAANQAQISGQLESIPEAQQAEARTKLEDMFKSVEGTPKSIESNLGQIKCNI